MAGGAATGGAAVRLAASPLLAAMGAVAQLPTQWSGAGGAACEVAAMVVRASSRNTRVRMERVGGVVTAECQPRKKFSAAPYYAA